MPEFEAIVPNQTGNFFLRGDVASLAETIEDWLKNKADKRDQVREACYKEIDGQWTPAFQMKVLRQTIG